MLEAYPIIFSFITAELFYLITNNNDIRILIKRDEQRKEIEKIRCKEGLLREKLTDIILFVPISIILFFLTIYPLISFKFTEIITEQSTRYSIMGVVSYGFPFAGIKIIVKKIAYNTLNEFQDILKK